MPRLICSVWRKSSYKPQPPRHSGMPETPLIAVYWHRFESVQLARLSWGAAVGILSCLRFVDLLEKWLRRSGRLSIASATPYERMLSVESLNV